MLDIAHPQAIVASRLSAERFRPALIPAKVSACSSRSNCSSVFRRAAIRVTARSISINRVKRSVLEKLLPALPPDMGGIADPIMELFDDARFADSGLSDNQRNLASPRQVLLQMLSKPPTPSSRPTNGVSPRFVLNLPLAPVGRTTWEDFEGTLIPLSAQGPSAPLTNSPDINRWPSFFPRVIRPVSGAPVAATDAAYSAYPRIRQHLVRAPDQSRRRLNQCRHAPPGCGPDEM